MVDATAELLTGFYKDRLAIQAQQIADPFIGKWMTVSGSIGEVWPWTGTSSHVTFNRPNAPTIYLVFRDKSAVNRLATLQHGDRLTVQGRIDRVEFNNIQLDPCKLIEVAETPIRDQLIAARVKGAAIRDQVIDSSNDATVSRWKKRHDDWRSETYDWLRRDVGPDEALLFAETPEFTDAATSMRLIETYGSMLNADRTRLDRELANLTKLIDRSRR